MTKKPDNLEQVPVQVIIPARDKDALSAFINSFDDDWEEAPEE